MENKKMLESAKYNSRIRIMELIQEYCDGSQQRFVEKTGLNKGAVSQYVNGKKSPTNLAASIIGDTFKVSAAWVMGFDVNKDENINPAVVSYAEQLSNVINQNKEDTLKQLIILLKDCDFVQLKAMIELIKAFQNTK